MTPHHFSELENIEIKQKTEQKIVPARLAQFTTEMYGTWKVCMTLSNLMKLKKI